MTQLWNRQTQQYEDVELVDQIEAQDLDCFHQHWLPPMQAKIDELRAAGNLTFEAVQAWNVPDAHWKWGAKFQERYGQLQWASYALRHAGLTQGMIYLNMVHRCRIQSQLNQHMVYVDIVSTAPWNRPGFTPQPKFGGVGLVLVTEAVLHSVEEGFGGRIGLHALPNAEPFYRDKLGMQCLGPDEGYEGLPYYEMTSERATEFLAS